MKKLLFFLLTLTLLNQIVIAHPGSLDENGGHYNRKTGEYHYHTGEHAESNSNSTSKKQDSTHFYKKKTSPTFSSNSPANTFQKKDTQDVKKPFWNDWSFLKWFTVIIIGISIIWRLIKDIPCADIEIIKAIILIQVIAYWFFSPLLVIPICCIDEFEPFLSEFWGKNSSDYFIGFTAELLTVIISRIFLRKTSGKSTNAAMRISSIIVILLTALFVVIDEFDKTYNLNDEIAIAFTSLLYFIPIKEKTTN